MQRVSSQTLRVQTARTTLLLDHPFFGVLALQMALREDPTCQTAWTDGKTLGFNPSFVDTLSSDQLLGLLAHEVMHPAAGHCWRRDARDAKRWNIAADYAINPVLVSAGFTLPEGALIDASYAGKSAEWIYDRLPASQDSDDSGQGNGKGQAQSQSSGQCSDSGSDPGGTGECRDAPADSDSTTEAGWQQTVKQAEKVAASQGRLPASMQRDIDKVTERPTDWRSALVKYIQETARTDYAWQRPNARYIASGMYLPSLHSQECGKIVVAVDTSGSIDQVLLSQFAEHMQTIMDTVRPSSVEVVYCDARVQHVDTFSRDDKIVMKASGGGGTAFAPVFDHVDASGEAPAVVVYLTDLYGSFPDVAPDYPVLWAVTGGCQTVPPFGDTLKVE